MSKIRNILLSSTSVDAGAIFLYQLISVGVLFSSHNGASVLACAYQLKVRSKNPKNFEYWLCQRLINKIRNVFIKLHQRDRWYYLSLFTLCWCTLPRVCLISLKNTSKTHRTLMSRAHVRKCAPA